MNKKIFVGIGLISILAIGLLVFLLLTQEIKIQEYKTEDYKISYDSTWKIKNKENLMLEHKKSGSTLSFQCKNLESYLINTNLKDLLPEITASIEEQNEGFSLISIDKNISEEYQSYAYLYEKGEEQALVNIYKKDTKLLVVYYVSTSSYYDIVLDSVDSILDSLEIFDVEK